MDSLVEQYSSSLNQLIYNRDSITPFSAQNHVNSYKLSDSSKFDASTCSYVSSEIKEMSSDSSEKDMSRERDYFDGVLKFIDQVLMEEEDVQTKPCMFHQCSALQAAEKSFYDVIGEKYPHPFEDNSTSQSSNSSLILSDLGESESFFDQSSLVEDPVNSIQFWASDSSTENALYPLAGEKVTGFSMTRQFEPKEEEDSEIVAMENNFMNVSRGKKIHYHEENEFLEEEPNRKQLATYSEETEESDIYDKVLLCLSPDLHGEESASRGANFSKTSTKLQQRGQSKESKAGRSRVKRQGNGRELIDLRTLLTQCAQAVATNNFGTSHEILKRIRQHSSPNGDGTERLAHYFANALEARLTGNGIALYTDFTKRRISTADILTAYQAYVKACPFHRMSNIFANKSISRLAKGATSIHIIDFGILYGFQWPCLIQCLSLMDGGPPKLRITGIDLPRPGFRPTERVEATGNHLANYCKRFNVPFEFNAIAKKWDSITLEELKIGKDEKLVVNCLYRLTNVPDETVEENSPRDTVLNLIKRICPDLFVHGVLNGTYNAPFFITRFRESLYHFSSLFDMFDATALREDENRMLFEQEVFARDAMNVIACEGSGRIERPETCKQWQFRTMKAGFRQLPLHKDVMKEVSAKVKLHYHKEFLVDEEKNWMLQGWKGRVLYAISLWKPIQD